MKLNRIGEVYITKNGEQFKIIEYFDNKNVTIKFDDGTIVYNKTYNNVKLGNISNKNYVSIFGFGFLGNGKYSKSTHLKIYNIWYEMLRRCYCEKFHLMQPKYIKCLVSDEWLNFQLFAEWCTENFIEDYHLDKDILVKNNNIYGPDTCCFVPHQINNLFVKSDKIRGDYPIGVTKTNDKFRASIKKFGITINLGTYPTAIRAFNVYKSNKEFYIHQVANLWKNKITEKVYQTLINYTVEITD